MKGSKIILASSLGALLAPMATAEIDTRDQEVANLRNMVETLRGEVDVLRGQQNTNWMTEQRSEQIRGLVQDVLADADTRSSLQGDGATSGYNKGFYIQNADGSFKLKINGQIQSRWIYNRTKSPDESSHGFENRRVKLKFSGNVIDDTWGYKITAVMPRNGGAGTTGMYLEDAWISKKIDNGWSLKIGQFKAPFLREELVSSSRQLTVERSMVNNAFTYGWTQGASLNYSTDSMKFNAWYGDGPHSLNSQSLGNEANAFAARGDFLLSGDWSQFKGFNATSTEGWGMMLGAAVAYTNYGSGNTGNIGNVNANKSTQYTVDLSIANAGFSLYGYYVHSSAKNAGGVDLPDSDGWVVQAGYMISDNTEIFGRYEAGGVDGLPTADLSAMTLGFNLWPTGNSNIKWTTDLGYAFDPVAKGGTLPVKVDWTSSGNGWQEDADDGEYVIRTQMQFLF